MLLIKTEVRDSEIAGKGVFALEAARKGKIIGVLGYDTKIMTEAEYQREQKNGNTLIIKTGARWVGDYFLYKDKVEDEEYFNYSINPNVLYHCGVCIALKNINTNDELTLDYRFMLAQNDICAFYDKKSGQKVDGISGTESLIQSAQQLINLLA